MPRGEPRNRPCCFKAERPVSGTAEECSSRNLTRNMGWKALHMQLGLSLHLRWRISLWDKLASKMETINAHR